ncbi:hypothetical protein [Desulfofustis glycolicus]|uniref:Uncharacterized protein n=1 Tax=Desulfofustis glycolicus DSM 9705 TaxID=1121409 RepID=A0A1M5TK99_9BACT|nr:hypothetical protein [Desulfofustis glycolicus]SHH51108.1 hypothetical protein SAMN02745124_00766 [Desulfofustis glycolicus DSM 9705]
MFALIKYLLYLSLWLVSATIAGFFVYFTLTQATDYRLLLDRPDLVTPEQIIAAAVLVIIPVALILLFAPLFQITPKRNWFSSFLRLLLVMLMAGFIGYQLLDGRKVYQLYTQKDLIVRQPEAGKASFLLTSLHNGSLGPIPTTAPMEEANYARQIETHRRDIETSWQTIAPYRLVIDQLAELSVLPYPAQPIEIVTSAGGAGNLDNLCRIYLAHAVLQIRLGNREQGFEELLTIHRVARNGLAGANRINDKMTWTMALHNTIRTAYRIVLDEEPRYEEMRQLAQASPRLTRQETSLRAVWLSQYLDGIDRLDHPANEVLADFLARRSPQKPLLLLMAPPWLFEATYRFTCQKNRTAADLRSFWEPVIEQAPANPAAFRQAWASRTAFGDGPPLRNLGGWYFHRPPDLRSEEKLVNDLYRISDIFAAFLTNKLEFGQDIGAHLEGGHRPVATENQRIIGAGADGALGTPDDIVLEPIF